MSVNMNLKAANTGDQLKHALLLEVLRRIPTLLDLTYAETHAGAGIYKSFHQVFEGGMIPPPIQQLREKHQGYAVDKRTPTARDLYHGWLTQWCDKSIGNDTSPGSALPV